MFPAKFLRLLPILAILAVAIPLLSPDLSSHAEAQEAGLTRTITIHEGFNLIVWGATARDAADLDEALPEPIVAVFGWDGALKQFDTWRREGPAFANTLEQIGPNQAI